MPKKSDDYVIAQRPNPPIIIALMFWVASILANGTLADWLYLAALGSIMYWALLEIISGVNTWRRILGATVFIVAAWSFIGSIN